MLLSANLVAFLAVIRSSEGTAKSSNPYAVTFGEQFTISDFSNHPALLGWRGYQWKGIWETAAGAYQINKPTWLDIQNALSLIDFSPASQDQAAVWLISNRAHAADVIAAGKFDIAINACSRIWASLPGSTSGQPQARLLDLKDIYIQQGGIYV